MATCSIRTTVYTTPRPAPGPPPPGTPSRADSLRCSRMGTFSLGGGIQGNSIYHPSTDQWTTFAPPPCTTNSQNCESAGALLNTGKVLVAGGVTYVNAQPYPIEETNGLAALFDTSTLTWTTTGSMNKSRLGET